MTTFDRLRQPLLIAALFPGLAAVGAGSALLAYTTAFWVPLALFAAAGMVGLAFSRPLIALHVAIASVPLELLAAQVGSAGFSVSEVMFVLTGAGATLQRVGRGRPFLVRSPATVPLLVLVLAIVPGLAVATESFPVVRMLLMWTSFYLVYQAVIAEADVRAVRGLLITLAVSGGVIGIVAAVQSGGGAGVDLQGLGTTATGRAQGSLGHPNTLATFECLALPAALVLALSGPTSWRPVALAAFLATAAGLALSLSRGGLLAILGALAVLFLWAPVRRAVVVASLVVAVISVTGISALGEVQQVRLVSERLASVSYAAAGQDPRFLVWAGTPAIIAESPIFGVGGNNFERAATRHGLLFGAAARDTYLHAHNIPLTIAAELGLIGLAALLWVAVVLARTLARGFAQRTGPTKGLVVAVAAALAALLLQGLVDYTLRSNVIVGSVFVLAAAAVVLARPEQPDGASSQTPASSS